MAVAPFNLVDGQTVWLGGKNPYTKAYRLNNANYRVFFRFKAPASQNLNSVTIVVSSTAGTLANIGTVNLYAVGADFRKTGAALATQAFTPANGIQTVTFGTPYGLTIGTYYIVEILNVDGTPASNRFDVSVANYDSVGPLANYAQSPISSATSTDTGTTNQSFVPSMHCQVTLATYGVHGTVIWASDATASGSGIALYNASGSRIARQASRFNFANERSIIGVGFAPAISGSPTHRLKAELIIAGSVVATSDSQPAVQVASMGGCVFSSAYAVPALTDVNLAITPEGASDGDASNFFRVYGSSVFNLGGDSGILKGSFESTGTSVSWSAAPYIFGIFPIFEDTVDSGGGGAYVF